ncbi:MAG: outer membrane beta-barrel protein [Candidatus Omnitrophota bacterium]
MKLLKGTLLFLALISFTATAHAQLYQPEAISQEFKPAGIVLGDDINKENNLKLGPASIKAALTIEEQFDSNIFLTAGDKISDYINIVRPKIFMDLPFGLDGRHSLQALYYADLATFADHSNQNFQNQYATELLNFKLPFGYLAFRDYFAKTSDRAGTEFTNRIKRLDNQADAFFGVEFNKLAEELNYTNFLRTFNDDSYNNFDYYENIYTSSTYYQLFPKTKVLMEYNYGQIDYLKDSSRDGNYNQIRMGLKGDITGKIIGVAKVGYQTREYDAGGQKGFNHFVSEMGLISNFSERTKLKLTYIDTAIESVYENNNYYNNQSFQLRLDQGISDRFTLIGLLGVDRNLYPEESPTFFKKREDTILTGGIGLEYQAKDWIKAGIRYQYAEDISNIDNQDYNDNLVAVNVTFMM